MASALDSTSALSAPITPRILGVQEKAAVRTKFGPATTALRGQQRASDQQQKNIGNWYDQYKADLASSYAKTAASYATAADTITGARDSAAAADTQRQDQLIQDAKQSAAQRGAQVDPNIAARAQQAGAANVASSNRDLAQTASVGAAQSAYAGARIPVAGAQALTAHTAESGRRRTINQSLSDLSGQKADFKINFEAQARKDAFNNKIATQAGLIKQQVANTGTKNANTNAARAGETARHNLVTEATNKFIAATGRQRAGALINLQNAKTGLLDYQQKHKLGGFSATASASEQRAARRDAAQQRNHTGPYAPAKLPKGAKESQASLNFKGSIQDIGGLLRRKVSSQSLLDGTGPTKTKYKTDAVNAALDLQRFHYVTPRNIAALERRGVRVPASWRQNSGANTLHGRHGG